MNEMDAASRGMANAQHYMAANGPPFPIQLQRNLNQPKIMTQAQLEEQKMNESQGLPSNLDEASRVVALEGKMETMSGGINAILQHLQGGPPPTPQVRPDAVPPVQPTQPLPPPRVQVPMTTPEFIPPVPPTVLPTTRPASPGSTPAFFPHHSNPPETEEARIEAIVQERLAAITQADLEDGVEVLDEQLQDAKRIAHAGRNSIELTEDALSPDEMEIEVVEEPEIDHQENLRLQRLETLVTDATQWIKVKDPLKFFKRFIGTTCNKNLSFNTWPATTQAAFTERFETTVRDPSFISTVCSRIMNMDNGHLVAPHVAGAFITTLAGFLSFAMTED